MNAKALPDWVASQLAVRAVWPVCARACGRLADGEVTWAGSGVSEYLCVSCQAESERMLRVSRGYEA